MLLNLQPQPAVPLTPEEEQGLTFQHQIFSQSSQLLSFEPFQWFMEKCIQEKINDAREAACDTTKTDEECRVARHVLKTLEEVQKWTATRQASSREYIDVRTKNP